MHKVCIIGGNHDYHRMFENAGWKVVPDIFQADLVQFTGGEDVTPQLYGEERHPTTGNSLARDLKEAGVYAICVRLKKPMAGICRGGQFLNVMNGGKMYQDVDGHAIYGTHECHDLVTDKIIQVTSTHHQMMRVDRGVFGGSVVAVADESSYKEFMNFGEKAKEQEGYMDIEVVWYPETNSLCFQPHPEFPKADSTREYYFELIERYLGFGA